MPFCIKCGFQNDSTSKFCAKCGTSIFSDKDIPVVHVSKAQEVPPELQHHNEIDIIPSNPIVEDELYLEIFGPGKRKIKLPIILLILILISAVIYFLFIHHSNSKATPEYTKAENSQTSKTLLDIATSPQLTTADTTMNEVEYQENWLCIPGERVGYINFKTSEKDLIKFFGKQNVSTDKEILTEGGVQKNVTYCFKGLPDELIIRWLNDNLKNAISVSIINKSSHWKLPENINIGTTLNELNDINQAEFLFSGFEWDYGGQVQSWGTGNLNKYNKDLKMTLAASNMPGDYEKYIGDKVLLKSKNKNIANLGIVVVDFTILLKDIDKQNGQHSTANKKLMYLLSSNAGLIGYFDDGTFVGCPHCDLIAENVKTLYKLETLGNYKVLKDGSLLLNNSDIVKPGSDDEFDLWAVINYKWMVSL